MAALLWFLGLLARHAPKLLVAALAVGLIAPALAEAARALIAAAVLMITFGAFLRVEPGMIRAGLATRMNMIVLAWVMLGVPLLAAAVVALLQPPADLGLAILLTSLAPPVGSATAIALLLGLDATLALLTSMVASLLSPAVAPLLARPLAGDGLALDPVAMAQHMLILVGGGMGLAMLVRHAAGRHLPAVQGAAPGLCVLGLLVLSLSAMHGMGARLAEEPRLVAAMAGLALLVNIGLHLTALVLFWAAGARRAITVGLLSGSRNVTLIWAVAMPAVTGRTLAELYLAVTVAASFVLPLLIQEGSRIIGWRPVVAPAPELSRG